MEDWQGWWVYVVTPLYAVSLLPCCTSSIFANAPKQAVFCDHLKSDIKTLIIIIYNVAWLNDTMPTAYDIVRGDCYPIATLPSNPLLCVPTLPPIELDTELSMASFCKDSAEIPPIRRKQNNVKFNYQILNKINQIKVACPDILQRQLAKL